jgi:microcystin-dependent protein
MVDSVAVLPPHVPILDASGDPIPGARLRFFNSGTTTPRTVYSDSGLTVSLGSVVYCDSSGFPVAASGSSTRVVIYVGSAAYKIIVEDALGATVATYDAVRGALDTSGFATGSGLATEPVIQITSSRAMLDADAGKCILANATSGNITYTLLDSGDFGDGKRVRIRKNSTGGEVAITAGGGEQIDGPDGLVTTLTLRSYGDECLLRSSGAGWVATIGFFLVTLPIEEITSATYNVTSADFGELKEFSTAASPVAVFLPTAAAAGNGAVFGALRTGANSLTVRASGTDLVAGAGSLALVATGDSAMIVSNGVDEWKLWANARPSLAVGAITSDLLDPRIVGGLAQVGDIKVVAYSTVPTGWRECDGSAISRTDYADLFAKLGTIHGTGDGVTTFNLPDYRGRFLRIWDHAAGRDPNSATRTAMATGGATGDNVGSVQGGAVEAHRHFVAVDGSSSSSLGDSNQIARSGSNGTADQQYLFAGSATDATFGRSSSYGTSTETRPTNATVMAIILVDPAAAAGASDALYTIHTVAGVPSASLGINGDYAIDPVGTLYGPKAAGAWPAGVSLVGPAGATGAAGAAGATGATGATGPAGAAGATGAAAPFSLDYTWSTGTSGDPGTGATGVDNATYASVTQWRISETDRLGVALSALLATLDDSTSTTKARVDIIDVLDATKRLSLLITGTLTDNGTYDTFPVSFVSSGSALTNGNRVSVIATPYGNKGTDGAGAGDFVGPASSVDDELVLFSGTTGKLGKRATTTGVLKATSGVIAQAVAGTDIVVPGGALGTPSSGTLTNATGLPVSGITPSTSAVLGVGSIELGHATDTTLSRSAAGELAVEGTRVAKVGKQTIWMPASSMIPRTTNGPSAVTTELATNDVMLATLDFDTTTEEGAGFWIAFPKSWNLSTVTYQAYWTAASGSGGVAFGLAGYSFSDDDAMDTAVSGQQIVTDTLIAANDLHISAESSAITIGGTPATNDNVYFEITREVANGSDTLGVDAKLLGIRLFYTTSASTDA